MKPRDCVKYTESADGTEKIWNEYNKRGDIVRVKRITKSKQSERWWEYDENNNKIHSKTSDRYEEWWEYDKRGRLIHHKTSTGIDKWVSSCKKKSNRIKTKIYKRTTIDELMKQNNVLG